MTRAKRLPHVLQRVARCGFCGRETDDGPLAHRKNPLCKHCLAKRLQEASAELGVVHCQIDGDYVEFVSEGSRTPA